MAIMMEISWHPLVIKYYGTPLVIITPSLHPFSPRLSLHPSRADFIGQGGQIAVEV